jgi:hypothetical protein
VSQYFADKLGGPIGPGVVEELVGLIGFDDLPLIQKMIRYP